MISRIKDKGDYGNKRWEIASYPHVKKGLWENMTLSKRDKKTKYLSLLVLVVYPF